MSDPSSRRVPREPKRGGLMTLGGRYVAEHQLARGGMGTVYAGRDTVLERPVAIKVFQPEPGAEPRNEFLREARAVAALKHPHIVDVYDAGVEVDLPYIVMEYVPGETLRELIAREAPVEPGRAAALVAEIATALDYAHRRGIVHCDIKPGNILLPAEDLPKIVDFGIAHAAGSTGTFDEKITGTAGYISPEQVEGVRPDGRTDVYSLAAVLYEMLTGAPPFAGRNLAAVAAQRLTRPPVPPRERNPAVPAELSRVVMQGLERDRDHRYSSAAEFVAALREYGEGATQSVTRVIGPASRPPMPVGTPAPWADEAALSPSTAIRRRRAPWAALAVLGAVVAGAVAAAIILTAGVFDGGSGLVSVPNVVNQSIMDAAPVIQSKGLSVAEPVQFIQAQQPFGTVIGQAPTPGARVKNKSDVQLTVSVGP